MAAFASDRRSGWVRVLVLILCALFIFATIATPPAYAVGETVALFGLAAVLSAATAALGFKLANNAEGQATLEKMVQDFTGASIAAGLVLTGSKVNGLINGMQYIKMAVHNGKTYLDERIFAWCQQWLAQNGVYDAGSVTYPDYSSISSISFSNAPLDVCISALLAAGCNSDSVNYISEIIDHFSLSLNDNQFYTFYSVAGSTSVYVYNVSSDVSSFSVSASGSSYVANVPYTGYIEYFLNDHGSYKIFDLHDFSKSPGLTNQRLTVYIIPMSNIPAEDKNKYFVFSSLSGVSISGNDTGLSGTDTLGKDVIDLTLDQILERLKEWAQDWYDAGADSVTNTATGAKDLPLSVVTGAATLNPDIAEDGPLIYLPTFDWPLGKLRSGETDTKTVDQGKENASAAETATTDVAENQTVIDSLVNWALGYISPDTGLFSKFPLCVPYDAYLLACAALGVDVVESDSIFSASPDDLSSIVQTGTDEQSEGFTPVFTISNDLTLDGYTYPLKLTIDLTDWTPLIKFVRLAISITVIAELIGAEYKRIKGK